MATRLESSPPTNTHVRGLDGEKPGQAKTTARSTPARVMTWLSSGIRAALHLGSDATLIPPTPPSANIAAITRAVRGVSVQGQKPIAV